MNNHIYIELQQLCENAKGGKSFRKLLTALCRFGEKKGHESTAVLKKDKIITQGGGVN